MRATRHAGGEGRITRTWRASQSRCPESTGPDATRTSCGEPEEVGIFDGTDRGAIGSVGDGVLFEAAATLEVRKPATPEESADPSRDGRGHGAVTAMFDVWKK